jgi:hypothetical protein
MNSAYCKKEVHDFLPDFVQHTTINSSIKSPALFIGIMSSPMSSAILYSGLGIDIKDSVAVTPLRCKVLLLGQFLCSSYMVYALIIVGAYQSGMCHLTLTSFSWSYFNLFISYHLLNQ